MRLAQSQHRFVLSHVHDVRLSVFFGDSREHLLNIPLIVMTYDVKKVYVRFSTTQQIFHAHRLKFKNIVPAVPEKCQQPLVVEKEYAPVEENCTLETTACTPESTSESTPVPENGAERQLFLLCAPARFAAKTAVIFYLAVQFLH